MIRQGPWKLLNPSGFGRETLPGEPRFELYHVVDDPGETHNLLDEQPEIAAGLKAAYEAWFDDVSHTRADNYAPPRIVVGSPHENPIVLTRQDWRGGTWARNSTGHWLLRVAQDGPYDVRLVFDEGDVQEQIQCTIGDQVLRGETPAQTTHFTFENVKLAPGDLQLEATLYHAGKPRGVHQVEVLRRQH